MTLESVKEGYMEAEEYTDSHIRKSIIVVLGFWLIFFMFYLLEEPIHTFIAGFIEMRTEYSVHEQLTKLYLFIIVLISIFSYKVSRDHTRIKLSISFLLLSLVLYMSESNMIVEKVQPLFGALFISSTAVLLLRSRLWLGFSLFTLGIVIIASGSLIDHIHERESIKAMIPTFILHLLDSAEEERLDVAGIAFVCLSAIFSYRAPLWDLVSQNKKRTLIILLASGVITVGNGLLHWQYRPSNVLHFFAFAITVIGFLGLIIANKRAYKAKGTKFKLITENLFYNFILFFFVLLPAMHGGTRATTALLVWLPMMFIIAIYLWRKHPVNRPKKASGKKKKVVNIPSDNIQPYSE